MGTYVHGKSKGLHIYDVDVEEGTLTERCEVAVRNSSYVAKSKNGKYLYSIEDEGVAVFAVDSIGNLERINSVNIEGMRGGGISRRQSDGGAYTGGWKSWRSDGRRIS